MISGQDCKKCRELLDAYVDEALSEVESKGVRRHLEDCSDCRVEEAAIRKLIAELGALPSPGAPESLLPRLKEALAAERGSATRGDGGRDEVSLFRRLGAVRVAAGFLALTFGAFLILREQGVFDSETTNPVADRGTSTVAENEDFQADEDVMIGEKSPSTSGDRKAERRVPESGMAPAESKKVAEKKAVVGTAEKFGKSKARKSRTPVQNAEPGKPGGGLIAEDSDKFLRLRKSDLEGSGMDPKDIGGFLDSLKGESPGLDLAEADEEDGWAGGEFARRPESESIDSGVARRLRTRNARGGRTEGKAPAKGAAGSKKGPPAVRKTSELVVDKLEGTVLKKARPRVFFAARGQAVRAEIEAIAKKYSGVARTDSIHRMNDTRQSSEQTNAGDADLNTGSKAEASGSYLSIELPEAQADAFIARLQAEKSLGLRLVATEPVASTIPKKSTQGTIGGGEVREESSKKKSPAAKAKRIDGQRERRAVTKTIKIHIILPPTPSQSGK